MSIACAVMVVAALGTEANAQIRAPKTNLSKPNLPKAGRAPVVRTQSSNASATRRPYSPPERRYAQNRQRPKSAGGGGLKTTETTIRSRPKKPRTGNHGNDVLDINNRHENQGHKKPLEVRAQRTIESWGGGLSNALGW
jgi:hypothetical protein